MKLKTLNPSLLLAILLLTGITSCNGPMQGKVRITNTSDSESIPVYLATRGKINRSMSEYRVVTGKSMGVGSIQLALNSVQDQMRDAISRGWQPLGGISVSVDKDYRYTCSQAIVIIK